MDFRLQRLTENDGKDIYKMLQYIDSNENGFINNCKDMAFEDFKNWLIKSHKASLGKGLENWMVPQNIYWLYADNRPVGIGKLRHSLTPALKEEGGHIGYAIAKPYRGKGYCTKLLELMLKEAAAIGIEKVLITVNNHNLPSIQVALKNGGVIDKVNEKRHYIYLPCN